MLDNYQDTITVNISESANTHFYSIIKKKSIVSNYFENL